MEPKMLARCSHHMLVLVQYSPVEMMPILHDYQNWKEKIVQNMMQEDEIDEFNLHH